MTEQELSAVAPDLGKTRLGKWRVSTASIRAYTMVFALIVIWLYFQWSTRSELYPY